MIDLLKLCILFTRNLMLFVLTICIFFTNATPLNAQHNLVKLDSLCLNSCKSKKYLFITGELHGIASNRFVEDIFQRELILKHGVRTILIEEPYTNAYLINKYLSSGDTTFLNMYTSDYPQKFKEVRESIINLYNINMELSERDKIQVFGIDIWENVDSPFVKNLFKLLLKKEVFSDELKKDLTSIIEHPQFPNNIFKIDSVLIKYKFTDYTNDFSNIIKSYGKWLKNSDTKILTGLIRQKYLYDNIVAKKEYFKGNVYTNFGYGHIDIGQKSTAYFLKNDTSFKYKIIVFYPYYYNCTNLPWIPIKKSMGYNKMYLKRIVKKSKVENGVYFHERKGKNYIIHVGQKGMHELE